MLLHISVDMARMIAPAHFTRAPQKQPQEQGLNAPGSINWF